MDAALQIWSFISTVLAVILNIIAIAGIYVKISERLTRLETHLFEVLPHTPYYRNSNNKNSRNSINFESD